MAEDIKIGNVIFENVTTYSQSDKIRDKRTYEANINGLKIRVTNRGYNAPKTEYICEGLSFKATFTNEKISFEAACNAAVKKVKERLETILKFM
jgi:hypothetical protein